MSSRPCNRCLYDGLVRDNPDRVHTRLSSGELRGVDVYVVPAGEDLDFSPDSPHWVCWYMELPQECAC